MEIKAGEKCIKCDSSEDDQKLKLCDCPKHYECLKKEIKENIKTNKNSKETVTSYKCENYNCPTCKKPYPFKFIYKGQEFELIDIERPSKDEDYIILESLTFIKEVNNIKNIFVVKLTEENLTIGRNDKENKIENDINDEEVTISRSHAILKFNKENGNLTIINDKGRYGVLVLIKDNIKLTANEKIYFQVTDDMNAESTRARELAPLMSVRDNYEKAVIAMNAPMTTSVEGIKIIRLIDFLLE